MDEITAALAEHAFEHLFIECLGWDHVRAHVSLDVRDAQLTLEAVAQKRAFTVFLCRTHRTVLADRRLLREVQQRLRKTHHEHILIYNCETPRKQVWQWVTLIDGQKGIRHHEHPFFSDQPPPRLLERIRGLAVTFQEEEQTTLPDVLHRVRTALLPDNEFNLFSKHPSYAMQSDHLAMAMKQGQPGAFAAFVELHMPLAKHASRMIVQWFGMDTEDAEQTAMIGLIEAARRFDPERGFQFSTYAGYWLRQVCQRHGLEWGLPIRVPPHLFWPCYRLVFTQTKLIATHGEREAESHFETELAAAGISRKHWAIFCAARHMGHLSDLPRADLAGLEATDDMPVVDDASTDELRDRIRLGLKSLSTRHGQILRLRYGIGDREHTLQEVADKLGVTRERVRQIQVKAQEKLERILSPDGHLKQRIGPRNTSKEIGPDDRQDRDARRAVDEP